MKKSEFIKIAFTLPRLGIRDEVSRIVDLLQDKGFDYLHLRKPEASAAEIKAILKEIPASLHPRIWLCDGIELAVEFDIAGIHLSPRITCIPERRINVTRGCHTLEELDYPLPSERMDMMFQFLSPVFDSISKPGYRGKFPPGKLPDDIRRKKVVALGGVTPARCPELKEAGFYGAAMLGAAWENKNLK